VIAVESIHEVVVDVNDNDHETELLIHWAGGHHSELRVKKNCTGHHSRFAGLEAIE
jgi:hypothetical protein